MLTKCKPTAYKMHTVRMNELKRLYYINDKCKYWLSAASERQCTNAFTLHKRNTCADPKNTNTKICNDRERHTERQKHAHSQGKTHTHTHTHSITPPVSHTKTHSTHTRYQPPASQHHTHTMISQSLMVLRRGAPSSAW